MPAERIGRALRALHAQAEQAVGEAAADYARAGASHAAAAEAMRSAQAFADAATGELRRLATSPVLDPAVLQAVRHPHRRALMQAAAARECLARAAASLDDARSELGARRLQEAGLARCLDANARVREQCRQKADAVAADELWLAVNKDRA